jgi:hypothetical protein
VIEQLELEAGAAAAGEVEPEAILCESCPHAEHRGRICGVPVMVEHWSLPVTLSAIGSGPCPCDATVHVVEVDGS